MLIPIRKILDLTNCTYNIRLEMFYTCIMDSITLVLYGKM